MVETKDFTGQEPAWCPGCGNFSLLNALKKALVELDMAPHQFVVVSGIGQAAKLPHYLRCNAFNGLHGRALPVATGLALANHELPVLVTTGDGDCYGEGGNHFLHAIRRNINITVFVHNNQIYGLTKGQASPTTMNGMVTKTQPFGSLSAQFNPLAMAIALDCGFVARGFVGDQDDLKEIMMAAIRHEGMALVDILQPCVTFNKVNTFKWYKERVVHLENDHDETDRIGAFSRSLEWGEKIPTGIFYQKEGATLAENIPPLEEGTLVAQAGEQFEPPRAAAVLDEFY